MSEIYFAVKTLADRLGQIQGINNVLTEFPRPDQELTLPSISLVTASSKLIPRMPTVYDAPAVPQDTLNVNAMHTVGEYELTIQMDIWTDYKRQREHWYGQVMDAFDSEIIEGKGQGLKLQMSDYHDVYAQYDVIGYRYLDNPEMSLKGEWRITCDVQAHFARIRQLVLPKVTQTSIMDNVTTS